MRFGSRYISSFFFGMLLLLPLLAMTFLQLGKAYIQSTREERLEAEQLVQVVLPVSNVVWEEEGRELWVGNRMFDVATYTVVDGHYHLTGVYDDDETEVAGSLLHTILSKNGNGLLHLLLLLQCFLGGLFLLDLSLNKKKGDRKRPLLSSPLFSCLHPVLGPPPRCFIVID